MALSVDFDVRSISPVIGTEVRGLDLSRPLSADLLRWIRNTIAERIVIVFKNQDAVTPDRFVGFARSFGDDLEIHELERYRHPGVPEIFVISNIIENGRPIGAPKVGLNWHVDHYHREFPALYTFLHGREIPDTGGHTTYANGFAAYDELPDDTKRRIERLYGRHSRTRMYLKLFPNATEAEIAEQRKRFPDILHPLVRTNPYNGRKALYLGGEAGSSIDGLPDAEGEALFAELLAWLTQPRFRYVHHWQVGDIVMSDQRGSIHRATEWDEVGQRRLIHRATVFDDHRPH
jgi:taurine dioxygenase